MKLHQTIRNNRLLQWITNAFTGSTMTAKQVFSMIFPIFIDSLFIVLISILNTAMVSSSGMAAVSAVSVVDSINIFVVSIFIAVATGGTVIVAQYTGKGDREQASKAAGQAISTVTVIAVALCILIIIFHSPILTTLFGSSEQDVLDNAKLFLIGSSISFPFFAIYQGITGALRGVAETKACLVLSVILNLTYFILNIVLITIFDMGVLGLAISYIAARVVGATIAVIYLIKINHSLVIKLKDLWKLHYSLLKKIMFIGLPFAAEQLFFNGGKLLTQTYIAQLGTAAMTVNAISNSMSMLFQVGGNALSVAIVTIVGQCIGRKAIDDARKYVRSFLWLSSIFFIFMTIILFTIFPWLIQLYSPPDYIIGDILALVILLAIAQPIVWSISFLLPAALRAAGDSKFTSVTALLSMWLFRVIFGYILGISWGLGVYGVWLAMVVEWSIRGIFFYFRYRGDKWYQHKLV